MASCVDPSGDGLHPISRARPFDLSLCFERFVLLPSLSAAFQLFAIASLAYLLRTHEVLERGRTSKNLLKAKIVVLVGAFVVACLHLDAAAASLQITTAALVWVNHTRARWSNTVLSLFWPLHILALAVAARTDFMVGDTQQTQYHAGLGVLELLVFIFELLGPEVGMEEDPHEIPLARANVYSVWSFGWLTPFMRLGTKKYVTAEDLYNMPEADQTVNLGARLYNAMKKHDNLWLALARAYGWPMFVALVLKVFQDLLAFAQPQLLRLLLRFLPRYQASRSSHVPLDYNSFFALAGLYDDSPEREVPLIQGFAIAGLMFFAALTQTAILHQYFQRCFETGMRVRAGLVRAIYDKALVLSCTERTTRATGDIVNLMSVDATRLQDLCTYGLITVSGPLQITLAFVSLYNLLGWPAFVGVAVMIVSIPLNTYIARILKKMQEQQMKNRDQRTRAMTEVLGNIKSIKLYAWEPAFIKRVLDIRNDREMVMLRKIGVMNTISGALWAGVPLLVAFASFAVAARTGQVLTSDVIFPAIALFMLLQFPLAMFGMITSSVVEALVSVRRLRSFLHAGELQPDARATLPPPAPGSDEPVLEVAGGEFTWDANVDGTNTKSSTLEGIDLVVKPGQLVGVLGRVGAGKTSLLSAIVGEMVRVEGSVTVRGTIALAPQNPWIMSGSVRDNITFSHAFEQDFYDAVLDACALRPDLETLTDGDLTLVGEKGITLSGGQRARIALARAVYARADLYLLDDVLAAVDSHVARHVFDNVIGPRGLLGSKARVLVTNTVAFVRQFDELLFMRRGIVLERASYAEAMLNQESELFKLIVHHGRGLTGSASTSASGSTTPVTSFGADGETMVDTPSDEETKSVGSNEKAIERKTYGRATLLPIKAVQPPGQPDISTPQQTKEHSEVGKVKWKVYSQYIAAASRTGFAMFVLLIIASQASSIAANVVLMRWGDAGGRADVGHYILLYGLCALASAASSALAGLFLWIFCSLRSARYLHDSMLFAVMRAPLSFFETTPTGRVMNLFSRDTYVVDQVLARLIQAFVRTLVSVLGIVAVICTSFPLFLVSLPPIAYVYHMVMTYYLATSRELKRLDAVSRSPIFSWFSESLGGLSTIRAFGQQSIFTANIERLVDRNQECYILSISVNRWLAIRLELLGAAIILTASCLALTTLGIRGTINAGLVGLVLSYGLNTTGSLNWVVRSASEVEQNIVSVERVLHYVDLEPEAPDYIEENKPAGQWPSEGRVELRNYSLRYRPNLPLVLNDISLDIKPREKVGICGRTGAGKSSLLLALFRIIEPASGTIVIDGVDITKLGLHDLRSAISIIPQEPQLFEGTMRENIDPTGLYQDDEIWHALEQSHLKAFVQGLPGSLDARVAEGGSSMSSGQRQLLCFARALLRKSTILVLDEATSAVDLESDKAIQDILHGPQFANVTMLTIAHRLHTIMESDRVLVLDAGKVAEFDSPENLIANRESRFYSLAAEAGLVKPE
ncbi:multidrug resistance-associated ABC transporter [Exidia glandulosa HHB12029]|uniref:Multidrug resistance-associated ABC transporter n=1 Tax=Exidia glandulosa HHB12029 TaxID=1314781 RepID=A0A165BBL4_EXIGL|nr:multidrug resistance-associated ABC transporter [Exidia glandulosa HHB12029]